ncbi:MAG TPA: tRNA (adenosine(37)-N6)-threonylcarbamoyltransferase complex dimerization subunit type 1 TsaB [Syntrophomonadaceae bacterium]|nr:tRNA (adenosine(37)-N6)-threonylcarbamoyltransferase complex dimerization subunit type 1 TsaB [Syntrophomonadaceae bacterium]HOQ09192.1 tRNA (adenosine(37)-N6)-threonylcarbamoyltransferase complex dimerization subunit type 1 TsaB [Syntrophomonadaceae bacterium]HPU48561.1 tRNA (adenosine(37)-N6)-threonylcarbamoyltransferase complex dimerization subunit type 1 TsaB [Syntrophomonadaceae bacterium]
MYILAIDSATPVAGAALLRDEVLIAEAFANVGLTHSETLMPMVDRILKDTSLKARDVDVFAVTIGPGSFTGLRIGLAAAKGLALAADKPLIGISTLEVLAHNLSFSPLLVGTVLDARKGEIYGACFDVSQAYPQRLGEEMACSPESFCHHMDSLLEATGRSDLVLLGDGFITYRQQFAQHWGPKLKTVPLHQQLPRAASLASLARQRALQDDYDDRLLLRPTYIRLSEAQNRLGVGDL